jgi:gliding motility-associated-like protein
MLSRSFFQLICLVGSLSSFAQNQNDRWLFGEFGGIDFTTTPPGFTNLPVGFGIFAPEVSATYCDPTTGAIRLFSNGWDVVGPDGVSIPGVGPQLGSRTATQGVFVPLPGDNNIVYLFLVDGFAGNGTDADGYGGLSYSIIDLALNAGQGGYVTTDVPLLTPTTEKVTVVKGCTGEDHWIVCHAWNSNAFYSYHLTADGLDPVPVISNVGVVHQSSGGPTPTYETIGQMKGSRDHSKLALVVGRGLQRVELFDFDNSTGVVGPLIFSDGNFAQLNGDQSLYGVEFSPDGSKLYTSVETQETPFIYQYDISSGAQATIAASRTLIFNQPNAFVYGGLQLGPDGRIYVAKFGNTLDVITNPNAAGIACAYTEDAMALNPFATCVLGLPQLLDLDVPVPESATLTFDECGVLTTVPFISGSWPLPITAFQWDFGDPASGAANTSDLRDAQHTFSASGTYEVELVVFYGCTSDTLVQTVVVDGGLPVIPPIPTTSVCVGGTVTLTAEPQGATSVIWTTGATTPSITVDQPGSYIITATNACGSTNALATVLQGGAQVPPLPELQFICLGDSITLNAEAPDADSYLWSTGETTPSITVSAFTIYAVTVTNACGTITLQTTVTGQPDPFIFGEAEASFCPGDQLELAPTFFNEESILWSTGETTPTITVDVPGIYTVTATNTCGDVTQSFTVTDDGSVPVIAPFPFLGVCDGQTTTLTADVASDAEVLWSTGETTPTITVSLPGTYTVTATNACGTSSATALVEPLDGPPTLQPFTDVVLCQGESITLSAVFSDGTVLWNTGATTTDINVNAPGLYTVTASNACGSTTASAVVSIGGAPPVLEPLSDLVACEGGSAVLSAVASGGGILLWTTGETSSEITVDAPGVYTVTATNTCGSVTASAEVSFDGAPPIVEPLSDVVICQGESTTLSAVVNDGSVLWNTGATTPEITVSEAGLYTVVATNVCGSSSASAVVSIGGAAPVLEPLLDVALCQGESITLNAVVSDGSAIVWNTGAITPDITVNVPGVYTVTATNTCGSISSSAIVTDAGTAPTVEGLTDVAICPTTSATLSPVISSGSVLWNTGAMTPQITVSIPGTYTVTATNACGSASASATVTFEIELPTVEPILDQVLCPGESTTLTAVVGGVGDVTWNTGATSPTIAVDTAGTYVVTVTNSCGTAEAAAQVSFDPAAPVISSLPDLALCAGRSVQIAPFVEGTGSYQWSTGATTTSIVVVTPGVVELSVTNGCGSDAEQFIIVDGGDVPVLVALSGDTAICPGVSVDLSAEFDGATALRWSTGDSTDRITITQPGLYRVEATNDCGTVAEEVLILESTCPVDPAEVYLPNTFTPDGDGVNDLFGVVTEDALEGFELLVFNRWGEQIWSANDQRSMWDGTYRAERCPDGIYATLLRYRGEGNTNVARRGHVTLLR